MNIGIVAERSGVSPKTIRYYESIELIRSASRAANGYRVYDENDVNTLRFIQHTRRLGFSMKDVADLLALWHNRTLSCAEVKSRAQICIAATECKIRETEVLKRTIFDLLEGSQGHGRASAWEPAEKTVSHVIPQKGARCG